MGQTHSLLLPAGALLALVAYPLYTQLYLPAHGPRITPGPESEHWFYGNMRQSPEERGEMEIRLVAEYGPVLSFFGPGNVRFSLYAPERSPHSRSSQRPRLLTTDVRAIAHVLQRADIYQKPAHTQRALAQTLGAGLLVAEGDAHRIQRKALNPAFGPSQIRDLTGIMLDKANELRDVLSTLIGSQDTLEVNIEAHLSRCTLDIIGLAGFGYDFAALSSGENELAAAFSTIFGAAQAPGALDMLAMLVPGFRHVVRICLLDLAQAHIFTVADGAEQAYRQRDEGHASHRDGLDRRAEGRCTVRLQMALLRSRADSWS
jgi:cytochrome P450